jgi:hypothetical protein
MAHPVMPIDLAMSEAWRRAASELGIRVRAPFEIALGDGNVVEVEAFLPDFGGREGALAVSEANRSSGQTAATTGAFVSFLSDRYRLFDEALFRETLDDWGWRGAEAEPPSWYTGRPWT